MKRKIISTIIICFACVACANAQLRYGLRFGAEFSHPSGFNADNLEASGSTGFEGGLQLEYQLPSSGLAFGVAVQYTRRSINIKPLNQNKTTEKCGGDFIEIPIDIKYKANVGIFYNLVSPFVFTGPDLALGLNSVRGSAFHTGWNVGGGIDMVNFIQISGGYRFGINKICGVRDSGAFVNVGILFDF